MSCCSIGTSTKFPVGAVVAATWVRAREQLGVAAVLLEELW